MIMSLFSVALAQCIMNVSIFSVCKTGEAKTTKGHKLPARFVIHTVGPRYNIKYITAAESALFSCYRSVLGQVR